MSLGKNVRVVAMTLAVLVALAATVMLVKAIELPATILGEKALFDHTQVLKADYRASLVPNPLFPYDQVGPGTVLFSNLVESLEARLSYVLETVPPTPVKVVYTVSGILQAYDSTAKEAVPVYQKEYSFVGLTELFEQTGRVSIDEQVDIPLEEYAAVITQLEKLTEFRAARAQLSIQLQAQATDAVSGAVLSEPVSSTMVIPIGRYFTVEMQPMVESKGTLMLKAEVPNKAASVQKQVWGGVLGLALAILALVALMTKVKTIDPEKRAYQALMAKYGSRIAKAVGNDAPTGGYVVRVAGVEDLAKIADEIGKPMILEAGDDLGQALFVMDGEVRYECWIRLAHDSKDQS